MTNSVNKTMGLLEWTLLIVLSLLWGGSFFFVEVTLVELRPFTVVFLRVLLAAIALNIVVVATGHRMPPSRKRWGSFFIMGLLNNLIPFSLIVWGQSQITGGLAAILNATTPLSAVVLAHFFTSDEKLTPAKIAGVLFGLIGVIFIIGPEVLAGLGGNLLAQTAVLIAAFSYSVAGLFGRRFKELPPLVTATGQITSTTVMMLPIVLITDRPWTMFPLAPSTWGALIGLAILSTTVAYIIYFRLLATAGATNLLLVTFLIPISAFVLGWLFLDEVLALFHVIGMVLISLGLVAIDGRLLKQFQSRQQNHQA